MKYPEKGFEQLYHCLKKDGLIFLALYSKIARSKLKMFQDLGQKIKDIHNEKIFKILENLIDNYDIVSKISNLEDFTIYQNLKILFVMFRNNMKLMI